ncbi:hypothetical protein [Burkholderia cepacia]|uniref:hypothetical protein n=1 Tax=Burkholderia cepacia TaxID=292 RepID=UPI002AAFE63A|nr:hypothetical protein [Burkholderia cepacia]
MKTLIGATAGFRQPCLRSRLLVKVRRIRLDFQELNQMLAILNAEGSSGAICIPEPIMKIDILRQSRICLEQITTHAVNEIASLALGERRHVGGSKVKRHGDAP